MMVTEEDKSSVDVDQPHVVLVTLDYTSTEYIGEVGEGVFQFLFSGDGFKDYSKLGDDLLLTYPGQYYKRILIGSENPSQNLLVAYDAIAVKLPVSHIGGISLIKQGSNLYKTWQGIKKGGGAVGVVVDGRASQVSGDGNDGEQSEGAQGHKPKIVTPG